MVTGTQSQCKASHIKPRRYCANQDEQAFDKGLISFSDEGQIIFSPTLPQQDIQRLGLSPKMTLNVVRSGHCYFLQYHRSHIFRSEPSITTTSCDGSCHIAAIDRFVSKVQSPLLSNLKL